MAANLSLLDTTITQLFRVRSTSELLAGCQTNHVVFLRLQVCLCVAYSKRYAIPGVEAKVGTICTKQLCAPFTNQQHPRAIELARAVAVAVATTEARAGAFAIVTVLISLLILLITIC